MNKIELQVNEFAAKLQAVQTRNLTEAAIYLHGRIRELISGRQPRRRVRGASGKTYYRGSDPSLPGAPPHQVSGQLLRSIAFEVNGNVARIGSNLAYSFWLEFGTKRMQARPFLRPALDQNKNELAAILSKG